jgi:glycosyltransferase involved in cell wall biosynthesis
VKVAIVHDWTTQYSGGERVLEQLLALYPDADLYCGADFVPLSERAFFGGKIPKTTFIQRLPFAANHFRIYLPMMPFAVEQLDMRSYELVISSSFAFAKGVVTGPDQLHICYCHSPIRYAWDLEHEYRGRDRRLGKLNDPISRVAFHYIRMWDVRTANGVDTFAANSTFIARRISKVYRRASTVVYPPVDVSAFRADASRSDYYLTTGRLVGYKRVDLLLEAFRNHPDRRLVVIGQGPELASLKQNCPANVDLLGFQPSSVVKEHLAKCRAFLFAGLEDFGIAMVEAQASGAPVICYSQGGAADIISDGVTGAFFHAQTSEAVEVAIQRFESMGTMAPPGVIRANAERFSIAAFRTNFLSLVDAAWETWNRSKPFVHATQEVDQLSPDGVCL